jgi:hypothetical protein
MKIEVEYWDAVNLISLLDEQNGSYMRCILNYVGEEKTWRVCIKRNEALIEKLHAVKTEKTPG